MYVWVHNFNVYPTELFFTASLRDIIFFKILHALIVCCNIQFVWVFFFELTTK